MGSKLDRRFLFVTQFLDECRRIEEACPKRRFKQPKNVGKGKLISLNDLYSKYTRAFLQVQFWDFRSYTHEHYTLILDEVIDVAASILFEAGINTSTRRIYFEG